MTKRAMVRVARVMAMATKRLLAMATTWAMVTAKRVTGVWLQQQWRWGWDGAKDRAA